MKSEDEFSRIRGWNWICPVCRTTLSVCSEGLRCEPCARVFQCRSGVWEFWTPSEPRHRRFLCEYSAIRKAEGRGAQEADFYRSLPNLKNHRAAWEWRIRRQSFRALLSFVTGSLADRQRGLRVIDLGAGNGWLSNRLAALGNDVLAVDVNTDPRDGLGCHIHYEYRFTPVRAHFDRLPLADRCVDLVVFNASFHYSEDAAVTLGEAVRLIRPEGTVVIMDTPLYRDARSGRQMVSDRRERFRREFGFPSDALRSEEFLTFDRLGELGRLAALDWDLAWPAYPWRWRICPLLARLKGNREPARFPLCVGRSIRDRETT